MVKYAKNNQTLPRNVQNWSKYAKNSQKLRFPLKKGQILLPAALFWKKVHIFTRRFFFVQKKTSSWNQTQRLTLFISLHAYFYQKVRIFALGCKIYVSFCLTTKQLTSKSHSVVAHLFLKVALDNNSFFFNNGFEFLHLETETEQNSI